MSSGRLVNLDPSTTLDNSGWNQHDLQLEDILNQDYPPLQQQAPPLSAIDVGSSIHVDFAGKRPPIVLVLERKLGNGASGAMYQAHVRGDQTKVAVKIFDRQPNEELPRFLARVDREYFISKQIQTRGGGNDAVVALEKGNADSDSSLSSRRQVIIFPLVDMMTLLELIVLLDGLKVPTHLISVWRLQVCSLCSVLCSLFARLHARGIFHRDIKLDNILVERIDPKYTAITEGLLKAIDFGGGCTTDIYEQRVVENFDASTCAFPANHLVAEYTCALLYADPRTYTQSATSVAPPPALIQPRFERTDGKYAVFFPSYLVPTLWPKFETYAVAVCIQFIIDSEARRSRTLPIVFTVPSQIPNVNRALPLLLVKPQAEVQRILNYLVGPDSGRDLEQAARDFRRIEDTIRAYDNTIKHLTTHLPDVQRYYAEQQAADARRPPAAPNIAWFQPNAVTEKAASAAKKRKSVPVTTQSDVRSEPAPQRPRQSENDDNDA